MAGKNNPTEFVHVFHSLDKLVRISGETSNGLSNVAAVMVQMVNLAIGENAINCIFISDHYLAAPGFYPPTPAAEAVFVTFSNLEFIVGSDLPLAGLTPLTGNPLMYS